MTSVVTDLFFFFFNDTATTEIYTLSLHDALPISDLLAEDLPIPELPQEGTPQRAMSDALARQLADSMIEDAPPDVGEDRKSTRLNSSHANISYAVFCLKKKKTTTRTSDSDINATH